MEKAKTMSNDLISIKPMEYPAYKTTLVIKLSKKTRILKIKDWLRRKSLMEAKFKSPGVFTVERDESKAVCIPTGIGA